MDKDPKKPPHSLIYEAIKNPGGWVYEIDQQFMDQDNVPPEAIKGAWKVDQEGFLTGDFLENPKWRRGGD